MDNDFAADVRKAFYGLPEDVDGVVLVKHSSICCYLQNSLFLFSLVNQ